MRKLQPQKKYIRSKSSNMNKYDIYAMDNNNQLSRNFSKNLQLSRYKLNQYYVSKFDDQSNINNFLSNCSCCNCSNCSYCSPSNLLSNNDLSRLSSRKTYNFISNSFFKKGSFIYEKLTNKNTYTNQFVKESINGSKGYDFYRDLFDNQYEQRLKYFNDKRKTKCADFNTNSLTNDQYKIFNSRCVINNFMDENNDNFKTCYSTRRNNNLSIDRFSDFSYRDSNCYFDGQFSTRVPLRQTIDFY